VFFGEKSLFFEVIRMVWNSTQSALYKTISTYNDGVSEEKKSPEKSVREDAEKTPSFSSQKTEKKHLENQPKKEVREFSEKRERSCPGHCPHNVPTDPISRIMSDGDMLLIAALIFVLWHEKADMKLIMALVIVLLG